MSFSTSMMGDGRDNNKNYNNTQSPMLSNIIAENLRLKNLLDEKDNDIHSLHNTLKDKDIDYQTLFIEINRLKEEIQKLLENEKLLQHEIDLYKHNSVKNENLDKLVKEIGNKNQTVNYLLAEIETTKKENTHKIKELQDKLNKLTKELQELQEFKVLFEKEKEKTTDLEYELKNQEDLMMKDNKALLFALEDKETAVKKMNHEILEQKCNFNNLENGLKNKIENLENKELDLNVDLERMKDLYETDFKDNNDKFLVLTEKYTKTRSKVDKLVELYEYHIKFLKERFENFINDISNILKFDQAKNEEKVKHIVRTCESLGNLMNLISQREASIEAYKNKLANMKNEKEKTKRLNEKLTKEVEELRELVQIKKLQKKIKGNGKTNLSVNNSNINSNNITQDYETNVMKNLKYYEQLSIIEAKTRENMELKNIENKLRILLANYSEEIKLLNDKVKYTKDDVGKHDQKIDNLQKDIFTKDKESQDERKKNKAEMVKLVEEIKKIKDKFIHPDKYNEILAKLAESDKQLKNMKDDSNRKRELIYNLRKENKENKDKDFSDILGNTNKDIEKMEELTDKTKQLSKDMKIKENLIKELRNEYNTAKATILKNNEEISGNIEKLKLNKIEIGRKDIIIKDLKEKIKDVSNKAESQGINLELVGKDGSDHNINNNNINNNTNTFNINKDNYSDTSKNSHIYKVPNFKEELEKITTTNKKLKAENERKENYLKILKAKNEALVIENEEFKILNNKLRSNISSDSLNLRDEVDTVYKKLSKSDIKSEKFKSLNRRIFKDLVSVYNKAQIRNQMQQLQSGETNTINSNDNHIKEGMAILNLNEGELQDFLGNNHNNTNNINSSNVLDNKIDFLLNEKEVNIEALMDLYYTLKKKLNLEANNSNNNNSNRIMEPSTQNKYDKFLKGMENNVNINNSENMRQFDSLMQNLKLINKIS